MTIGSIFLAHCFRKRWQGTPDWRLATVGAQHAIAMTVTREEGTQMLPQSATRNKHTCFSTLRSSSCSFSFLAISNWSVCCGLLVLCPDISNPLTLLNPNFVPTQPSKKIPSSRLRHSFLRASECRYKDINGHHVVFFPHSFSLASIPSFSSCSRRCLPLCSDEETAQACVEILVWITTNEDIIDVARW